MIGATVKVTGAWNTVETGTVSTEGFRQLTATTHETSRPATTTIGGSATAASAISPIGARAAGVSTNEGDVEPGPIAHRPR